MIKPIDGNWAENYVDKILCGDCLELMKGIPDGAVDLVVTDPPYGIAQKSGRGASWTGTTIANDDDVSIRDKALIEVDRICSGATFCFGSWKRPIPLGTHSVLIYDKGPATGMGNLRFPWKLSHEMIYVIGTGQWQGKRTEGVLHYNQVSWESMGRCHPNQKPIDLIRHILSKVKAGLILDPFCGSGTTCVAAKQLGRRFIGLEISEAYCAIARERLKQEELF